MQEKITNKNFKVKKITIVGVIPSFAFQRAKCIALELHKQLPQRFPVPDIVGMLELDWNEKLMEWRQTLGREFWCLRRPVAVFFDDKFIGSDVELIKISSLGNILWETIPRKDLPFMKDSFRKDYISYLKKSKRIYCYLDICVDDVYVGTLTFQLYSDLLPRTCENFKTLCLGNRGPLLSYKGSRIHRIVKEGWLQGGDIQYKTGGGGYSIYCDPLEDECFGISHDRRGVLSMANGGRHRNGSQFFITLKPSKWMDTHYVAFGQVIEGVGVLRCLEKIETLYECPLKKIEIKSCGKLDLDDVEDVDAMYREEPMPKKKPKIIETISEQVVRLIMEAITDALARKERMADILDDGDVPSKMNLQMYFQGFYSIPEEVFEGSAQYLRNLRRELLRTIKPSATEIVEVIMYDLQMAVLTRMTTLDDVRETVGHGLYKKMIEGIDMTLALCQKPYVKRLVDQITSTAESLVDLVTKKMLKMKSMSFKARKFQEQMQGWVQSFVLQETFQGDNYRIAYKPEAKVKKEENKEKEYPKREGGNCCEKRKKKNLEDLEKLKEKFPPEDICCLGSKLNLDLKLSDLKLSEFFKTCRYGLRKVKKQEDRISLLELIEIKRFNLRWMRGQVNRTKPKDRLCLEKKIRKWMTEVVYTPETHWIRETVFDNEDIAYDHIEEIMYGAMTAGLLEMYYFMEEYMKLCGGKKQRLVTRTIYPEESKDTLETPQKETKEKEKTKEGGGAGENLDGEGPQKKGEQQPTEEPKIPECKCGHPCCVCEFDPHYRAPPPPPSLEEMGEEGEEEGEGKEEKPISEPPSVVTAEPATEIYPCGSDMELVDLKTILAEKSSFKPEEIDIRSFRWLKPYILEEGCDLKSKFATEVHKWLEGDKFNFNGFISKHSLVTRASLLSLSLSLAEILKEDNNLKKEIKDFIYDLWELYFREMFKEVLLEFPPEPPSKEESEEKAEEEEGETEKKERREEEGKAKETSSESEECKGNIEKASDFDFDAFCAKFGAVINSIEVEEHETSIDAISVGAEPPATPPSPKIPPPPPSSPSLAPDPSLKSDFFNSQKKMQEKEPTTSKIIQDQEGTETENVKKKKSPIVIEELVDESSDEEVRNMPPYVLPFWVKFLTELTKQALGAIAKVSRLPRRLYFLSDADIEFDEKMKAWFEFNAFNPQPTKGREIMDYISLHHRNLTNLEDTARSYLKKKKYSGLLNRCTRITSADDIAEEIVTEAIGSAMGHSGENDTFEHLISHLISAAVTSNPDFSEGSHEEEENSFETDQQESNWSFQDEDK